MAAGQFRSCQWDPVLIIAQIITMQCLFYVGLGTCVAVIDFIFGYSRSLSSLFVYQVNMQCYVPIQPVFQRRLRLVLGGMLVQVAQLWQTDLAMLYLFSLYSQKSQNVSGVMTNVCDLPLARWKLIIIGYY